MVSLLGLKEGEYLLNTTFQKHAHESVYNSQAPLLLFDVNQQCKSDDKRSALKPLLEKIRPFIDGCGIFEMADGKVCCFVSRPFLSFFLSFFLVFFNHSSDFFLFSFCYIRSSDAKLVYFVSTVLIASIAATLCKA